MRRSAVFGFAFVALLLVNSSLADDEYDREGALAASQNAIGEQLGDYSFRSTEGQQIYFREFRGKPMVVSMIYTSCHHICPMITQNLEEKVAIARDAFGDDSFTVVTIGFDWRVDTAEQMRVYASSRGAKGFDHLSQTTVVDADGVVYRQVYGQDFDAPALVEPLKELVFNTPRAAGIIEHWVDTFRFFCTVYDPNSGRYLFDYSILMTIFVGILCLGAILSFIVREWRRSV